MPETSDPALGKSSPRNLLLVEEYDALAIAIGSALQKFAPQHERHVVASISEAEKAADDYRPELIVIDLDPPQRGIVRFIERLRAAHPAARLLAVGCGTSREYGAARGERAGIRFIEKPFELVEFGGVIEELSEPGDTRRGTVAEIALPDLIALECVTGSDAVLRVEAGGRRAGELHFADGQLIHAIAPGLLDIRAIEEMARWRKCDFAETDRPADGPRTIHTPWSPLLVDLLGMIAPEESAEVEETAPRRRRRKPPAPGKKIVVIDDTELLLEFVEEILSASDPSLDISTAHTGTEGVRRAQLMRPDLVLLDYSLPDINGDEVCKRLLADEKTAPIPIIMMSGHLAQMAATAEQYENVVATVAKPFLAADFVQIVTQTLASGPRKSVPRPKPEIVTPPAPSKPEANGKSPERNGGAAAQPAPPLASAPPAPIPPPPLPAAPLEPPAAPATPPPPASPAPAPRPAPPPRPTVTAVEPERADVATPRIAPISAPPPSVPVTNGRTVLLGIPLEPISIQLTPALKIGQIRARAASRTVSLVFPQAFQFIIALQTGFDIESIKVNERHQLETIWLAPNRRPLESLRTNDRFNVDDVEIAPSESLELVPNQATTMRVQMLAAFKLVAVELSPLFDVSRLVLSAVSRRVRVSLEASTEAPGSIFELHDVRAEADNNLDELVLSPV